MELVGEDAFADTLVEDVLAPVAGAGRERSWPDDIPAPDPAELPLVSIGRPRAWGLEEVLDDAALPSEVRASLARERFLLVRLSCSFRPRHNKTSIEFARLSTELQAQPAAGHPPVAFDLYPRSVEHTSTVTKRVSFAPTLAFMEIEAGIGELGRTIEYPAVEPVVSASGIDESTPSWDFSAGRGRPVNGGKLLFAVVSAPRAIELLRVSMSIAATLDHHGLRLPALLGGSAGTDSAALSAVVWKSAGRGT